MYLFYIMFYKLSTFGNIIEQINVCIICIFFYANGLQKSKVDYPTWHTIISTTGNLEESDMLCVPNQI